MKLDRGPWKGVEGRAESGKYGTGVGGKGKT